MKQTNLDEAFKKGEACYFINKRIKNDKGKFLVCICVLNESGFYQTDAYLVGNRTSAGLVIKSMNEHFNVSPQQAEKIINSGVAMQDEIDSMIKLIEIGGEDEG